jgi:hypothetical protein
MWLEMESMRRNDTLKYDEEYDGNFCPGVHKEE